MFMSTSSLTSSTGFYPHPKKLVALANRDGFDVVVSLDTMLAGPFYVVTGRISSLVFYFVFFFPWSPLIVDLMSLLPAYFPC